VIANYSIWGDDRLEAVLFLLREGAKLSHLLSIEKRQIISSISHITISSFFVQNI